MKLGSFRSKFVQMTKYSWDPKKPFNSLNLGTKAVRLEGTPHLKIRQRVRVEGGADGVRRSVLAVAEMRPCDF